MICGTPPKSMVNIPFLVKIMLQLIQLFSNLLITLDSSDQSTLRNSY